MKKIIASIALVLGLGACTVLSNISSASSQQITYYSYKLTETAQSLTAESIKLANAVKANKPDSAIIYALNVNSLIVQELQYKDSLIKYINNVKDTAQ